MKNKVPFVDYPLQYKNLKEEIDEAIEKTLLSGDLILRKDVEDFEKNIASFVGTEYAIGVNSCSDALILSLMASGITKGDEVITVSHTFFSTIEAIVHCGATPVLVDIDDDFLINPDEIEEALTKKTKAIIPVHLNGRICQMEKIMEIAKIHNLIVIEDAAQALGATFNGQKAGSFGLTGCFSFYPAKILGSLGDGGIITTNNKEIAEKTRLLRHHCQKNKTEIVGYGFTSRLHNLQAAVLNVKFKYISDWIRRRREIAKIYKGGLSEIKEIKIPPSPGSDSQHFDVYQNYVIRAERRDGLRQFLTEKSVETLIKDPVPNHLQDLKGGPSLNRFRLPATEKFAKEILSLPIYPELTDDKINYVISCIQDFYKKS